MSRCRMPEDITDADLDELVARMNDAAKAFVRGDIDHYLTLFDHPEDYTLMGPTGGDVVRGFVDTEERRSAIRDYFTAGDATLEVAETYASGDLAVIVAIERQHGVVGGLEQDWSLRVTLVLRREGDRWQLVHRHADALTHEISMSHVAELARGLDG
jgi:ketosteroid isomerase-like protein